MGGIDTQELLPFGDKEQVQEEVLRQRRLFRDKFIASPSHEALLPNVPFENVMAMSEGGKAFAWRESHPGSVIGINND